MIGIRQMLQRRCRRVLVTCAIALVALLVALEHSGASSHEMSEGMEVVAGICLAVVELAVVAVLVIPLPWRRSRRVARSDLGPASAEPLRSGRFVPPARASPAVLQVLLR